MGHLSRGFLCDLGDSCPARGIFLFLRRGSLAVLLCSRNCRSSRPPTRTRWPISTLGTTSMSPSEKNHLSPDTTRWVCEASCNSPFTSTSLPRPDSSGPRAAEPELCKQWKRGNTCKYISICRQKYVTELQATNATPISIVISRLLRNNNKKQDGKQCEWMSVCVNVYVCACVITQKKVFPDGFAKRSSWSFACACG